MEKQSLTKSHFFKGEVSLQPQTPFQLPQNLTPQTVLQLSVFNSKGFFLCVRRLKIEKQN